MGGFTIDRVSWHTSVKGNPESKSQILRRFLVIARFLQDNELTTRELIGTEDEIGDDFQLHTDDLREVGVQLMRKCYDQWLRGIDRGKDPEVLTVFERGLSAIRAEGEGSATRGNPDASGDSS